jgi:FdhD protein
VKKFESKNREYSVLLYRLGKSYFTTELFHDRVISRQSYFTATLDAVFAHAPPVPTRLEVADAVLCEAPAKLRAAQSAFEATGGLHGAGLFDADGSLLVLREDIGRHNAVDKVIGHALQHGLTLTECFLLVSGRVSFEIMQKSLVAQIPMVAAISAPSSLAVEFAQASGQTLIGFLRPPTFNRYAG